MSDFVGLVFNTFDHFFYIIFQRHLFAGETLYKQDDEAKDWFVVLNGRLRSVVKRQNGKKELSREYGRHETVGQMEVLTETTRFALLHLIS